MGKYKTGLECTFCKCRFHKAKAAYWHLRKEHKCTHDEAFAIVGLEVNSLGQENPFPEDRKYVHAHKEYMNSKRVF